RQRILGRLIRAGRELVAGARDLELRLALELAQRLPVAVDRRRRKIRERLRIVVVIIVVIVVVVIVVRARIGVRCDGVLLFVFGHRGVLAMTGRTVGGRV